MEAKLVLSKVPSSIPALILNDSERLPYPFLVSVGMKTHVCTYRHTLKAKQINYHHGG